ncbi:MAG TPA: PIG-L family deacetylase [Acidimicrobiales bacterium]|jgi:LmbE family N-acetylglucosaminyl deacetylase|nr:PIG-L family deacetylase [Acidimicrobiales bacterium]
MGTMVCFHAHPDDECIITGGVMAKAASQGHRVVLVVATKGENGEVPDGFLGAEELLGERRVEETRASAKVLGAQRVEFLGYVDSGMMGTPENEVPGSFWTADLDEAGGRLAAILDEEDTDVLTTYDDNGGYGHPDHIQVHRVSYRAAELAAKTPRVYEATLNRDHIIRGIRERRGFDPPEDDGAPDIENDENFGKPESIITAAVDVSAFLDHKRRAMQAHPSQISDQSFFLKMPAEGFAYGFGTEWFIRRGQGPGITETDIL